MPPAAPPPGCGPEFIFIKHFHARFRREEQLEKSKYFLNNNFQAFNFQENLHEIMNRLFIRTRKDELSTVAVEF